MTNIKKLIKDIAKDSVNQPSYDTGLVGEKMIISAYKRMDINKLRAMLKILNMILKEKIEVKRANESKSNATVNNIDDVKNTLG